MAENSSCSSASSCSRSSCEGCPSHEAAQAGVRNTAFLEAANANSNIKHVIGVVSGKGGVGKSMVTSSLAGVMARAGYKVGILDADITGPSIPKMFGVHGPAAANEEGMMLPEVAEDGTKIMSINLILDDEESPVVWRGPVIAGVVKQFWTDVEWGELDYLFVDMPPGTSDVALTVFKNYPVSGAIIVSTPQDLVHMIVGKAVQMIELLKVPVIGIIENMAYILCPHCGEKIYYNGESSLYDLCNSYHTIPLASIAQDPEKRAILDKGMVESIDTSEFDNAIDEILAI